MKSCITGMIAHQYLEVAGCIAFPAHLEIYPGAVEPGFGTVRTKHEAAGEDLGSFSVVSLIGVADAKIIAQAVVGPIERASVFVGNYRAVDTIY
jgi:hypothetical protein